MSSFQENAEDKKQPRRRRPGGPPGRRRPGAPRKEEGGASPAERAPRPERPPAVPFPSELIGKTTTGIVNAVVRRGKVRFGFINLGNDEKANDVARIYFNFDGVPDADLILRRGYPVEFTAQLDDKGRPNAVNVKLTEAGKSIAVEREAVVAQRRAERAKEREAAAAAGETEKERKPRGPRAPRAPRKPVEDKPVTLKITCAGHKDPKNVEVNLAHSVGKLKAVAAAAFDAPNPTTLNVYHVNENGEKVFLTRSILNKLTSNDTLHLDEPQAKA